MQATQRFALTDYCMGYEEPKKRLVEAFSRTNVINSRNNVLKWLSHTTAENVNFENVLQNLVRLPATER